MSVFALFRRKSKEEASGTETVTEEAEAAADALEVLASSEAGEPAVEAAGAAPAEVVEIPKQQSAEEAADREAGESARS
ncbi:gliding motility protein [Streptomyces sp. NPDC058084]|uniref:gliding motility protein n=1 Tax=Streptomyces sp. NPDC058084 TaxID=3346333 RepID=UPI0036EA324B